MDITFLDKKIILLEIFFNYIITYYVFLKITNIKKVKNTQIIISIFSMLFFSLITTYIIYEYNKYYSIMFQIIILIIFNKINYKKNFYYIMSNTIISLGVNYVIFIFAISISFIPNAILNIENDYNNLSILLFTYITLIFVFFRLKRIKNGIIFLQTKLNDDFFNLLVFNVSMVLICVGTIYISNEFEETLGLFIVVFSIIMFFTIKKSLELYYKQTLMIKDLKETKKELEESKNEIQRLEAENIEIHKKDHSIAHKQRALEFKLNELMKMNAEISEDINIKDQVENLSKEIYQTKSIIELSKTDIPEIDDMLKYMQSECIKNNIEFDLKINGNIHYMVNNIIPKDKLEILLADHIKDAIIAINSTDNINKSILVRIGKIDEIYSLYIYDSGIEFEEEILKNLGKEPVTTHENEGGTGMGFMNTFDTLRTCKASLIIEQYGMPCADNFTKVLMIKFDGKNEYRYILGYNNYEYVESFPQIKSYSQVESVNNEESYPQKKEGVLKSE